MKKQIGKKNSSLWRKVFDWLGLTAKIIRRKLDEKGKSFQPLPKEAPH